MGPGITLPSPFAAPQADVSPVSRHAHRCQWTDPQSRYTLYILQIDIPAGATATVPAGVRDLPVDQPPNSMLTRMATIPRKDGVHAIRQGTAVIYSEKLAPAVECREGR